MNALLRSVWHEPRPAGPPPLGWRDWALVGGLIVIAVLEGTLRPDIPWRVATIVLTVALIPTLLGRRSQPLLMVAIAFTVLGVAPLLMAAHSPDLNVGVFVLLLAYSLFRWGAGREMLLGAAIILFKMGFSFAMGHVGPTDTFGGILILGATAALGMALRYRANAQLRELDQVKLLERERLARDLHDTVAHHVSAMAIRAQAGLATAEAKPEAAVDALRLIEAEASRALTEMRGMVRLLREYEPADRAPGLGIRVLEELAVTSQAGPHVDVEIEGDLDGLSPPVVTSLYRLAQESVTNARRHARHASRIAVRVTADETSVYLRVTDDGEAGTARHTWSPGYGLVGMTERVQLLGGTFQAGPDPERERGWTVSVAVPRNGPAS